MEHLPESRVIIRPSLFPLTLPWSSHSRSGRSHSSPTGWSSLTLELKRDLQAETHPSCEVKSQVWKPTQNTGSCPRAWGFPSHLLPPLSPLWSAQKRRHLNLERHQWQLLYRCTFSLGQKLPGQQKNTPGCSERQKENRKHFFVPRYISEYAHIWVQYWPFLPISKNGNRSGKGKENGGKDYNN